jgi:hypothetical protein
MSELKFYEDGHKYESIDLLEGIDWVSVSTLVSQFKEPFIAKLQAEKSSVKKTSKWFGVPADEILEIWASENLRSTTLGTWYHNKEEKRLLSLDFERIDDIELPIFQPIFENGVKVAPPQKLIEGVYPEHFMFSKSEGVCGQSDKVIVIAKWLDIKDYKTSKELKKPYTNWEGITKKLMRPLQHLNECDEVVYGLQFSTYATIVKRHNPLLTVRDLTLSHIVFEEAGRDKWDYPITRLDENKEPIVKDIIDIKLPYYKNEVETMFKWLQINRNNLRKK